MGPGQERHLRHELGHVVQQKSFNITPTKYIRGLAINDDKIYEESADKNLLSNCNTDDILAHNYSDTASRVIQRYVIPKEVFDQLFNLRRQASTGQSIAHLNQIITDYGIVDAAVSLDAQTQEFVLGFTSGERNSFKTWKELVNYLLTECKVANEGEKAQAMQVKFGFELTFNNSTDFNYTFADLCFPTDKTKSARKILPKFVQRICDLIAPLRTQNYRVLDVKLEDSKKVKWTNAGFKPQTIIIIAQRRQQSSEVSRSREVPMTIEFCTVDLDPSCIEVQTHPLEYEKLSNESFYRSLISAIFSAAARMGLVPASDPSTGGGGHISIDAATAFLETGRYLRNFFVLYLQKSLDASSIFQQSRDLDNAPFPHEIDLAGTIRDTIQTFGALPLKDQTIENFVRMINNAYDGHGSVRLRAQIREILARSKSTRGKVRDSDVNSQMVHYQAVNFEHIIDEPKDTKRIEMRRFDAQRNLDELHAQITELLKLILSSRQKPLILMS